MKTNETETLPCCECNREIPLRDWGYHYRQRDKGGVVCPSCKERLRGMDIEAWLIVE